jgi:hypothetical protein
MIQELLTKGRYKFNGTLKDFKKCLSSFKITSVIRDEYIGDVYMYMCYGFFRYHSEQHKISIDKAMNGTDVLYIKYLGVRGSNE